MAVTDRVLRAVLARTGAVQIVSVGSDIYDQLRMEITFCDGTAEEVRFSRVFLELMAGGEWELVECVVPRIVEVRAPRALLRMETFLYGVVKALEAGLAIQGAMLRGEDEAVRGDS